MTAQKLPTRRANHRRITNHDTLKVNFVMPGNDSVSGKRATIVGTTFVTSIMTAAIAKTINAAGYMSDHLIFAVIF